MSKLTLKEANVLVHNVNPDACEAFLRKYPKIRTVMTSIARKNKDLRRGYAAFLKFKDKQEGYLGGRAEVTTSPTFGEKVFYKYDWMGTKGWAEVYQYIDGIKSEEINEAVDGVKVHTIDEASLSRVYQHVSGHPKVKSWGMMSGFRNANTKQENQATNQQLEKDLRAMNLGFFKVQGHWKECQDSSISWQDCPKDQLKDSVEESFFIPNINNEQLLGLTQKYNQDAAVYGDKENPGEAFLLFKNGSTENIGKFNANKVSNAYSQMKGDRSFLFSKPEAEPETDTKKNDTDTKLKSVLKQKVKNPQTGRDIQVQSALKYDTNHPVYKLAQRMLQQQN